MAFWRRQREPEVLRPGRATVLTVGSSLTKPAQQRLDVRLRVRVELDDGERYEVTTAWSIDHAQAARVQEGRVLKVDVVDGRPEEVRPRDSWATWDPIRTPSDPKVRRGLPG